MKLTILGCGTSTGVPSIGCDCAICRSPDPRNQRTRASALFTLDSGHTILVDTAPDLRFQALKQDLRRVDAVFFTHCHADHTHGIDELRSFNFLQRGPIEVYGADEHLDHIRRHFSYIFQESVQRGGGKPNLSTHTVTLGETFQLHETPVTPIELRHGVLLSVGWRVGDFAYCTDVSAIPETSFDALRGARVLVLGALRWYSHPTHYTVEEAVQVARRVAAERTILTHMGHDIDYADTLAFLEGSGVEPAWDGMSICL